MTKFLAAVAFLTRVPVRSAFTAADVGGGAMWFPVVGAAIGLAQYGLWLLLEPYAAPLLVAVSVVAFAAWLTRALHLDGLADFVDGLGGGRTADDVLRIMKDSRIGAFGAVALMLVILAKVSALATMTIQPAALVLAGALSRWSVVALGVALPYAREGSESPSSYIGRWQLAVATAVAAGLVSYFEAVWSVGVVIAVGVIVGAVARRRLGGVTGDVLGANAELTETLVLAVAASR